MRVRVIGVGPGDPDQVTVQAVRAMREVAFFVVPDKTPRDGTPDPLVLARERLLEAHLESRDHGLEVVISDERDLLMETGGGLVKAAPLIDCDPFLALNSDNLWIDGPADTIKLLASQWDDSRMDALLLLVPQARALGHKGMGDFHMDREGRIRRRDKSHVAPFVFTGIQVASKRLLRDAPEGPFSTNLLWDRAIAEGRAFGAVHQGLWFDVGTPQSIPYTEAALENV